ncbi:MAG TPA: thiamine pyrophosphate-dependent enzyme [Pirellulales bacterium]|nr:thiamine pyrophosphate-dependent enzyme [Pirellulales bacterium]
MATTTSGPERGAAGTSTADLHGLSTADLLRLYEQMVLIRRFELAAQDVYKKGEMPGFIHLYIGEEATAVGVCAHLRLDDWITSTHRGHGHALAKGVPPELVMGELYAKVGGCCGGRGGSMHLYAKKYGLFGTNGFVGGGIPSSVGAGLSARTRKTDQVTVCFFGDGAVNHGSFHESINFAGVQKAPVIFVCENNLYATATPLAAATANTEVATKAVAYGIPGVAVDGNDVLAMWEASRVAVERARRGEGPTLIEAKTYRTVGHHEGEPLVGTYRTQEELDQWKTRCPIERFAAKLLASGRVKEEDLRRVEAEIDRRVHESLEYSRHSPSPDPARANDHVWAEPLHPDLPGPDPNAETVVQGYLEAVRDAVAEEMRRDPHTIYMGEGTGERGGSFAHTKGMWHEFGGHRMIDTPISELGFTGTAVGASASGVRAVADLMFVDFMFDAATQIIQQGAKLRYMSNGQLSVPMIVRASWGTVKCTGPHHSGSYHPMWAHCPGLIVVVPSNPADAKGLMKTAFRCSDPVLMLEPKALFSTKGPVPKGEYFIPFGVANIVRAGNDLTIVSCGTPLHRAVEAAEQLAGEGISCEVIDLRTIVPLDVETIAASVAKTGHLLVVDEAFSMCGVGAEIAAAMMELAFDDLDAPIGRLHPDPTAHPFSPIHEAAVVITTEKVAAAARAVLAGKPILPRRLNGVRSRTSAKPAAATTHAAAPAASPPPSAAQPAATNGQSSRAPSKNGVAVIMPNQDLTITEGKVISWGKKVGDPVVKGETVAEVETDKAVVAIEAPANGRLVEIVAPVETVVALGQTIGIVEPS